jgi:hypothetical protein
MVVTVDSATHTSIVDPTNAGDPSAFDVMLEPVALFPTGVVS